MLFSEVDLVLVATVNVIQFHVNEGSRHVWADRDQSLILRAASSIGNTEFLSVTDFFPQKGGKPNIFRYFSWYFYR